MKCYEICCNIFYGPNDLILINEAAESFKIKVREIVKFDKKGLLKIYRSFNNHRFVSEKEMEECIKIYNKEKLSKLLGYSFNP
ncbi:hypothetical protein UFOVP97_8 [uncultured Caudovirales phage]|uniref:Uncharacterized protein n=1 Tax=uncultured Caudovirales phage TaxID=2100421 RepID=A0A6J5LMF9_9CAUD|nr:hypothetical protein UFOVP97_8 [uncultured Caudovirales phage]CAB4134180.1 hypothetical protein UFOVP268_26 [uncultured Caudovirales phage]